MTILVDTSVWVEWLIGSPTGRAAAAHLTEVTEWIVPTVVQLELSKWLDRTMDEDRADEVIALTNTCRVVVLDTDIALAAAELCRDHRLSTADGIVLAHACAAGARLVTCDAHFRGIEGVDYIAKRIG